VTTLLRPLIVLVVALAPMVLVACVDEPKANVDVPATVFLTNNSGEPVSMWIGHGEPDATALLKPGESRGINVTLHGYEKAVGSANDLFISDNVVIRVRHGGKTEDSGQAISGAAVAARNSRFRWDGKRVERY